MHSKLLCLVFIFRLFINVYSLNGTQLVEYAVKQYTSLTQTVRTGTQYPNTGEPTSATWGTTGGVSGQWTAGFYPGVLWHLYNYTKNEEWKSLAIAATDGMAQDQNLTNTHDIGFMILCSYNNGYEFTKNESYPKIIANAANHLATRYSPIVGCTRSWDGGNKGEFLVIVDNMMNLELLFRGWEITGNKTLYDMAVSHANKTIINHLRSDYSSYHVVAFNETNGSVVRKYTAQGYSNSSCWSRGQAWLVNGFTTTYRYTKSEHFLTAAENVAKYYIDNLPADGVTYWDFNVPHDDQHKYIPRDSSAAAIAASGLFELYTHTKKAIYLETAQKIMTSLFSSSYRADGHASYKLPALIVNATTAGPNAAVGKHDLAITYGEYYFAKAIQYLL